MSEPKTGVLLPGVDPSIGEIALATLQANEQASLPEIVAALARKAPHDAVAAELVNAIFELVLCRSKGALLWIEEKAGVFLTGARRVHAREAMVFGTAEWPFRALLVGPPQAITIRTSQGPRVVWAACEGLGGVTLRQSDVVALANALVERFGAKVIEDRQGKGVLRQALVEQRATERARQRAEALSTVDRLTVEPRADARASHARVALAEAVPGSLENGLAVHPEGAPTCVYEVERRVNESWVVIVAQLPGSGMDVDAGTAWVRADGRPPVDGAPIHAGFTDDDARAKTPPRPAVVLPAFGEYGKPVPSDTPPSDEGD